MNPLRHRSTKLIKVFFIVISMVFLLILINGCASKQDSVKKVNVSAAISLQKALEKIQKQYQQRNPKTKITFNFASSGALQKQIEAGAPADLFISAGKKQMDDLNSKGLIKQNTLVNLLGNRLVLIIPKDSKSNIKGFRDLASIKEQIAIGTPETVPAGKYAQETLQYLNLWDAIKSRVVYTKDVSQVLTYVESGNVAAGLVYNSDLLISDKVKLVAEAPKGAHKPIIYPAAITTKAVDKVEAKAFLEYLKSTEAQKIFKEYGFNKV